ncbi:helix-turn-helix domain-containing protein [Kurthia sibirica]|uniref:Insertion element IS150 protein InsJ-like helix-turn-helix domain-containing protein n=1 Tax=Kurthia sibirica TaxID=202750 RepID=A0A2U3AJN4_9BACL|nr:helix-turn-helix domain-containing protein [Kurthia sibirica]PWI24684.1 hypothetical protein DEX24_12000 [Kurthia sibirica]GEK34524.1 hypothetical protein KSI01_20570 [Kurthia sibirica]
MSRTNNSYSNELKLEVVQAYLKDNERMQKMADRYEIRNISQVKAWIKKYKEVGSIQAFERLLIQIVITLSKK